MCGRFLGRIHSQNVQTPPCLKPCCVHIWVYDGFWEMMDVGSDFKKHLPGWHSHLAVSPIQSAPTVLTFPVSNLKACQPNGRKYVQIKKPNLKSQSQSEWVQSKGYRTKLQPSKGEPLPLSCWQFLTCFFAHAVASVEKQRREALAESCQVPRSPLARLSWRRNTWFLPIFRVGDATIYIIRL